MRRVHAVVGTGVAIAMATSLVACSGMGSVTHGSSVGTWPEATAPASSTAPGWPGGSWGPGMGGTRWHGATSEPDYLVEMVAHHEEAVAAARELARSERAEMRAFGESIVATQSAQIRQMNGWLGDWYPGQADDADYQPMMRDLSPLSGDELDRAFLEDMIGHHMTAVMMSQRLLRSGTDHEAVARLAQEIRDAQRSEIVQMRQWLAQWFGTGVRDGTHCGGWSVTGGPDVPGR